MRISGMLEFCRGPKGVLWLDRCRALNRKRKGKGREAGPGVPTRGGELARRGCACCRALHVGGDMGGGPRRGRAIPVGRARWCVGTSKQALGRPACRRQGAVGARRGYKPPSGSIDLRAVALRGVLVRLGQTSLPTACPWAHLFPFVVAGVGRIAPPEAAQACVAIERNGHLHAHQAPQRTRVWSSLAAQGRARRRTAATGARATTQQAIAGGAAGDNVLGRVLPSHEWPQRAWSVLRTVSLRRLSLVFTQNWAKASPLGVGGTANKPVFTAGRWAEQARKGGGRWGRDGGGDGAAGPRAAGARGRQARAGGMGSPTVQTTPPSLPAAADVAAAHQGPPFCSPGRSP